MPGADYQIYIQVFLGMTAFVVQRKWVALRCEMWGGKKCCNFLDTLRSRGDSRYCQ